MSAARVAVDHELPPLATSAGEARRLLRDALATSDEDSLESAQLAVSEIVTNALVHAGTPMRLRVLLGGPALRVELTDGNPRLPQRRGFSPLNATGRGLHLVTELVDRWGAYPTGRGKVVWFEIAEQAPEQATVEVAPGPRTRPSSSVEVRLLNLPALMHDAWQEHGTALLREYLLYRLEDDADALETHATVSDALAILLDQIPTTALRETTAPRELPGDLLANASEPRVSLSELVLTVDRDRVDHFVMLHQVLEEASELADRGELLTPPTQPEIRLMRQWICEQVWIQSEGGRPTAWVSTVDPEATPGLPRVLDWDPAEVDGSGAVLIAADDTNRIAAISDSALAALGYAERSDLVGQRLISIIPWRYHQAHVAGFTLHLLTGRDPLLGRRITVPLLRADGAELEVEMQIEPVPLPSGRRVFTAELFLPG